MIRALRAPLATLIMFFTAGFVWQAAREMAWWTFALALTASLIAGSLLAGLLRRPT